MTNTLTAVLGMYTENKFSLNTSGKDKGNKLISFDSPSPKKQEPLVDVKSSTPVVPKPMGTHPTAVTGTPTTTVSSIPSSRELKLQEQLLQRDQELSRYKMEKEGVVNKMEGMEEEARRMGLVVSEYEQTISNLLKEQQQLKTQSQEREARLIKERNQALDDVRNVENAFSDVHRKYERIKEAMDASAQNEERLRMLAKDLEIRLKKQEEKNERLKLLCEEQLATANLEKETIRRAQDTEISKLRILHKKSEMKISSLEMAVDQKTKENKELASICDELINKVSS